MDSLLLHFLACLAKKQKEDFSVSQIYYCDIQVHVSFLIFDISLSAAA